MGWPSNAPCRGRTALFFSGRARDIDKAKSICAACPFAEHCLAVELERNATEQDNEIFGVYGGMAAAERLALLRERGQRPLPTHCQRGHEFTPENTATVTRISKSGVVKEGRRCRRCHLDRTAEYKARKRRRE